MKKTTRMERNTGCVAPNYFGSVTEVHSAWHETPREIEAGLRWGKRKAVLLEWVRREMARRLTERQQEYMALHYFRGLSCQAIGKRLGVPGSSVCRGVQRALKRLIDAAQHLDDQDPLDRAVMRLTGRGTPRRRGIMTEPRSRGCRVELSCGNRFEKE